MKKILLLLIIICLTYSCRLLKGKKNTKPNNFFFLEEKIIINEKNIEESVNNYVDWTLDLYNSIKTPTEKSKFLEEISKEVNKEQKEKLLKEYKSGDKKAYHFKVKDSLIYSYASKGYNYIINQRQSSFNSLKVDSSKIYKENKKYNHWNENNLELKVTEFKDSIKIVKGYNKKIDSIISYEKLKEFKQVFELYVTRDIKLKFHPTFKYKIILDKYFPVEIQSKNNILTAGYDYIRLIDKEEYFKFLKLN